MELRKWISNLFKEVLVQWIVAFLGSTAILSLLAKWVKGSSLFNTLKQEYSIPLWAILLTSSAFLAILLIYIRKKFQNRFYQESSFWKEKKNYESFGLYWDLTPHFFQSYEYILTSQTDLNYLHEFLRSCIVGPFCPECNQEMAQIHSLESFVCSNGDDLKKTQAFKIFQEQWNIRARDRIWDYIRELVYKEAQGKARSGKL